jgi:hypothetical protein
MPTGEHCKGAGNKIRYPEFPAVTGTPGIRLCRRRFVQTLQEPLDDSPPHAIPSFFECGIAGRCTPPLACFGKIG